MNIVARTTIGDVGAIATIEIVVVGTAMEFVTASSAEDPIVAVIALVLLPPPCCLVSLTFCRVIAAMVTVLVDEV